MANEMDYEVRDDGILFYLQDGINALVSFRTTVRHSVTLWEGEKLLPSDVGDLSAASFRKRLTKEAARVFEDVSHLEENLGHVAVALGKELEAEEGGQANTTTLNDLLRGTDGQSVTERLVRYGSEAELFHDPEGEPYATVKVDGHYETWSLKSRGYRNSLRHRYYVAQKGEDPEGNPGAPRTQALNDALAQLEAKCQFEGPEHEVHVRVAQKDGAIYIDLADDEWRAVEVTSDGWRVVSSEEIPVKFKRTRGMLALPVPDKVEGAERRLRALMNIREDDHDSWCLLLAWLIQTLRPQGPYPILILQGEQGSAKSTVERLLKALVDPSTAPLRTTPRNEHDLYIAATSAWLIAFDNISNLQPWLSDALCRVSTGGGFSTRTLYENREQELFDAMRPVILNGISDVASRPDLLDRAIILTLPEIEEDERRPESEVWEEFDGCRSAIFGALLSAVSAALRELPHTELEKLPRMADFALWATAAEGGFRWEPGTFMRAYAGNREEAIDVALETDPVAGAVFKLMEGKDKWVGSATQLWKVLGEVVDEQVKQTRAWPSAPHTLAGRLKRLAPALRGKGIEYLETREGRSGSRVKKLRWIPEKDRQKRQRRQPSEKDPHNVRFDADAPADASPDADASAFHGDALRNGMRQQEAPANGLIHAGADASDASSGNAEHEGHVSAENGERLSEFFKDPPGWFLAQGRLCAQQGAPERLLNPLSNAVSMEVFGSPWRWREVQTFVEKKMKDLR